MLGELVGELKGKITGQRIVDVEGPTMETNVSATGTLAGAQVRVLLTNLGRPVSNGMLHGWGNGVVMSTNGEMASYTGDAIGKIDSSGTVRWRGALFCKSSSNGKLGSQ